MVEEQTADLSYIAEHLRPLAVPIDSVHPDPDNAMDHPEPNLAAIRGSLAKYGQRKNIVVNRRGNVIEAGNGTWKAAKALGWSHVAVLFVEDDAATATGYAIADNRTAQLAEWDFEVLYAVCGVMEDPEDVPGLDADFLSEVAEAAGVEQQTDQELRQESRKTLAERFVIPPFSIMDARQGYWQERKRAWLGLGIQSEVGRGGAYPGGSQRDAATYDGQRGDGRGRPIERERERECSADGDAQRPDAAEAPVRGWSRVYGQDLMKGENPNFG